MRCTLRLTPSNTRRTPGSGRPHGFYLGIVCFSEGLFSKSGERPSRNRPSKPTTSGRPLQSGKLLDAMSRRRGGGPPKELAALEAAEEGFAMLAFALPEDDRHAPLTAAESEVFAQ